MSECLVLRHMPCVYIYVIFLRFISLSVLFFENTFQFLDPPNEYLIILINVFRVCLLWLLRNIVMKPTYIISTGYAYVN